MNYTTISSLGNLALANSIVTSVDMDSLVDEAMLSNYLDKRTGGIVSGNVEISGTFSGGSTSVASGENSFAYGSYVSAIGSNSYAIGNSCLAGCYGWYYDHIDFANNTFYLTTTQPQFVHTSSLTGAGEIDPNFNSGFEVGDVISYVNKKKFDLALSVVAVNGNQISVEPFKDTGKYSLAEFSPNHDDWSIFCPAKPLVGSIWFGEGAYAEGFGNVAVNAYSHAEGAGGFAYGQYAHTEGKRNRAGYASHAEGADVSAIGQYCHAEGNKVLVNANDAHAEGYMTSACNLYSHAEGNATKATAQASHAEGLSSQAAGNYSHAEGQDTYARGNSSHTEGCRTKILNAPSNNIGYAHAEGYETSATFVSHSEGWNTYAQGEGSHSEGRLTIAKGSYSHAAGISATAANDCSYAWNGISSEHYNPGKGAGTYCINPADGANGFYIGLSSLKDLINAGFDESQLLNYLDKRTGGIVSGDISILSGNFVQTTDLDHISLHTQNGFASVLSTKYGDAALGSKGFCILSVISELNQIIVSGLTEYSNAGSKNYNGKTFESAFGSSRSYVLKQMLKTPDMALANIALSDLIWSVSLFDDAFSHFGSITDVQLSGDNTIFTFDHLPNFRYLAGKTIEHYKAEFRSIDGDNALYVPGFPELGNQEIPQFFSQHVEGGSSKAIGKFSHAEGRDTLADSRYSHAEGTMTLAGGIASHSEGQENIANGRSSHSEGEHTQAIGRQTHAEGEGSIAYGDYSHVEGYKTQVGSSAENSGNIEGAHAEGFESKALNGDGVHAEGYQTSALNAGAHSEGYKTEAFGIGSHAEGGSTSKFGGTAFGSGSHVEGYQNIAIGNASHAEGYGEKTVNTLSVLNATTLYSANLGSTLKTYGDYNSAVRIVDNNKTAYITSYDVDGASISIYLNASIGLTVGNVQTQIYKQAAYQTTSHVEGYNCRTLGESAHAEGSHSIAKGNFSHAEGRETKALETYTHTEGYKTTASGQYSHAEGSNTQAIGTKTHAEGDTSIASGSFSHAEGYQSKTGQNKPAGDSEGAHAEGYQTSADGDGAHSEGRETKANGIGAHAEGYKSEATIDGAHAEGGIANSSVKGGTASGKASHAEGYITQAKSLASHAEGRDSIANSHYSHVEGYNTKAGNVSGYEDGNGEGAHAEGSSSEANGKGAHAEGISTKATGNGAHAEGVQSEAQTGYSHAEGYNTRANGEGAHAEGSSAKALNKYAHAEGYQSEANNIGSHAAGFKAKANANYSWCWNGISSQSNYTATNEGSFCINPKDGISNFYIGTDNFIQCVLSAVQMMSDDQKNELKSVLGIA